MPTHVAETRSRTALAAFQGFIIEYFTAQDPAGIDDTFARFVDEFLLAPSRRRMNHQPPFLMTDQE